MQIHHMLPQFASLGHSEQVGNPLGERSWPTEMLQLVLFSNASVLFSSTAYIKVPADVKG